MERFHKLEPKSVTDSVHNALKATDLEWQAFACGFLSLSDPAGNHNNTQRLQLLYSFSKGHPKEAKLLTARWIDRATIAEIAYKERLSADQVNRLQRQALERLVNFIIAEERQQRNRYMDRLGAAFSQQIADEVIGHDEELEIASAFILSQQAPWIMVINGAAGSGKSRLAAQAFKVSLKQAYLSSFAWMNAHLLNKKKLPNHLGAILDAKPDLLVIDNFDTGLKAAIDLLLDRMTHSKILLTSRSALPPHIDVLRVALQPLRYEQFKELWNRLVSNYQGDMPGLRHLRQTYIFCAGNPQRLIQFMELLNAYPYKKARLLLSFINDLEPKQTDQLLCCHDVFLT